MSRPRDSWSAVNSAQPLPDWEIQVKNEENSTASFKDFKDASFVSNEKPRLC